LVDAWGVRRLVGVNAIEWVEDAVGEGLRQWLCCTHSCVY